MRIRPGRGRSLLAGVLVLLVMVFGVVMLFSFGGLRGMMLPFLLIWVIFGLVAAAAAFYNALSRRGLPLYEVDMEDDGTQFCPDCGRPVGRQDTFCRTCGKRLADRET
jgi:hypothetical protein